jgi:hypothetical protein
VLQHNLRGDAAVTARHRAHAPGAVEVVHAAAARAGGTSGVRAGTRDGEVRVAAHTGRAVAVVRVKVWVRQGVSGLAGGGQRTRQATQLARTCAPFDPGAPAEDVVARAAHQRKLAHPAHNLRASAGVNLQHLVAGQKVIPGVCGVKRGGRVGKDGGKRQRRRVNGRWIPS